MKKKAFAFAAGLAFAAALVPVASNAATANELRDAYQGGTRPIKILVVPGHDDEFWGTQYKDLKEADMNLRLANELYARLAKDKRFDVMITRDREGYKEPFGSYFAEKAADIRTFISTVSRAHSSKIASGEVKEAVSVPHNRANDTVALRLFGINKWSNDNAVDLVLHIHFNDNPGRPAKNPGPYAGITVYIPESQYGNFAVSNEWGGAIYKQLARYYPSSTYPPEKDGLVQDQDLIAIGSANSLNAGTALVEYGYIYEPQYQNAAVRRAVISDYAYQTFLGIHGFFGDRATYEGKYGTPMLPHAWGKQVKKGSLYNMDVLALQAALRSQKLYPAAGMKATDCRMTGHFDPCTVKALKAFQSKYKIEATGELGPKTRSKLNALFGR